MRHATTTDPARHRHAITRAGRPRIRSAVGALAAVAALTAGTLMTPGGPLATSTIAEATVPGAAPAPTVATAAGGRLAKVVAAAKDGVARRIPYRYGGGHGATPSISGGADCSGFVRWAYYRGFGGLDIGSGGSEQIRTSGRFVRTNNPVPGDVVLFGRGGSGPAYHSAIYIGRVNGHPAAAAEVQTGSPAQIQQWHNSSWGGDLIGYYRLRSATAADTQTRRATATGIRITDSDPRIGERFDVVGSVRFGNGAGVAGVPLKLYQRTPGGSWRLGSTVRSNVNGNARFTLTANSSGHDYRVVAETTSKTASSTSPAVRQAVSYPIIVTNRPGSTAKAGSVGAIYGRTAKALKGQKIRVQRTTKTGWVPSGGATIVGADGRFSIHWRLGSPGGKYYRLRVLPTTYSGNSVSGAMAVVLK